MTTDLDRFRLGSLDPSIRGPDFCAIELKSAGVTDIIKLGRMYPPSKMLIAKATLSGAL